jgi:hypothetical protein
MTLTLTFKVKLKCHPYLDLALVDSNIQVETALTVFFSHSFIVTRFNTSRTDIKGYLEKRKRVV